jgi:uncharacterized protein YabE (DUF348 family)
MKFFSKKISGGFRRAHHHGKRHLYRRPYLLPIFGLVLGAAVVLIVVAAHGGQTISPLNSHVVYLFDGTKKETLDTRASTVGDLLGKLPLDLTPQDVVEPSKNTPIVEDNFRINIYRARPVTIIDGDGAKTVILTAQRSPRVVAQDAGLKLNPEDEATFVQGSLKENILGEKVVISRATPIVLNLYGTQVPTYTQAKTIGGLLVEKNIKLGGGESVVPAETTAISPGQQIFVLNKGSQIVTAQESVPAPVQYVDDASLSFGTTVVRQAGSPGAKVVTYIVASQDGKETDRTVIQEVLVSSPVPQIIARGTTIDIPSDKTGIMASAGIKAADYGYVNYIISRESGWCPTKWQGEYGNCPAYHGTPSYSGYGLGQATPGSKMASAGADWATNPVTQLRWCSGYAIGRYGSWEAAQEHWAADGNW